MVLLIPLWRSSGLSCFTIAPSRVQSFLLQHPQRTHRRPIFSHENFDLGCAAVYVPVQVLAQLLNPRLETQLSGALTQPSLRRCKHRDSRSHLHMHHSPTLSFPPHSTLRGAKKKKDTHYFFQCFQQARRTCSTTCLLRRAGTAHHCAPCVRHVVLLLRQL